MNSFSPSVEWNEKQREERKQEFAPISSSFVRADEVLNPRDILEEEKNEKSLMFTSKKLKRRNHSPDAPRRGAAIPPPATFDYYGPTTSKQQRTARPPPADLEASISAGLKFLREQVDKGNKHKFTAANEYTESWTFNLKFYSSTWNYRKMLMNVREFLVIRIRKNENKNY